MIDNLHIKKRDLRNSYLFHLIKLTNNDTCYRCKQKIELVDELSIEHKKSWFKVDPNLFWDMDNIAFSHLSCNCASPKQGTGKLDYFGISAERAKNEKDKIISYKAYCQVSSKNTTLGLYKTQEEAAICRDLGTIYHQDGKGKLNFEQFREEFKKIVDQYKQQNRELFGRYGSIKLIVSQFYDKLKPSK